MTRTHAMTWSHGMSPAMIHYPVLGNGYDQ